MPPTASLSTRASARQATGCRTWVHQLHRQRRCKAAADAAGFDLFISAPFPPCFLCIMHPYSTVLLSLGNRPKAPHHRPCAPYHFLVQLAALNWRSLLPSWHPLHSARLPVALFLRLVGALSSPLLTCCSCPPLTESLFLCLFLSVVLDANRIHINLLLPFCPVHFDAFLLSPQCLNPLINPRFVF